jgi:oligopeptidase A
VTLNNYRRGGAGLGTKERVRLSEISVELSQLRKEFSDSVLDATNAYELVINEEAKLAGLPESARTAARESAKQKGLEGWRFTLQEPSYRAVMTYLDDARIREKVFRAYNSRATGGTADNLPAMKRILELRCERAKLLGFQDYADLMTEDRMAKNGARVREFLASLKQRTREFYDVENAELLQFRRSLEGPNAPPPAMWDLSYYSEKLRKSRYDFDEEAPRPYFPDDRVLQGMFATTKFARRVGRCSAPSMRISTRARISAAAPRAAGSSPAGRCSAGRTCRAWGRSTATSIPPPGESPRC